MNYNRDFILPFSLVVLVAFFAGIIIRYTLLNIPVDNTTANLAGILVFAALIGVYFLFAELINSTLALRKTLKDKKADRSAPETTENEEVDPTTQIFINYTEKIMDGHIDEANLSLLKDYIYQFSQGKLPEIERRIEVSSLTNEDLYHYCWNLWNHFDRPHKQQEACVWFKTVYKKFGRVSAKTIEKKMKIEERFDYKIPIEENIH